MLQKSYRGELTGVYGRVGVLLSYGSGVDESERNAEIQRLYELMQRLYLSTACAGGNHLECRLVDKYRGLVCCCPDCGHEGPRLRNVLFTGPLLHPADTFAEQRPGYIYREGLGRRVDLVRLATDVILRARNEPQGPVLFEITDRIALLFAPRFG